MCEVCLCHCTILMENVLITWHNLFGNTQVKFQGTLNSNFSCNDTNLLNIFAVIISMEQYSPELAYILYVYLDWLQVLTKVLTALVSSYSLFLFDLSLYLTCLFEDAKMVVGFPDILARHPMIGIYFVSH